MRPRPSHRPRRRGVREPASGSTRSAPARRARVTRGGVPRGQRRRGRPRPHGVAPDRERGGMTRLLRPCLTCGTPTRGTYCAACDVDRVRRRARQVAHGRNTSAWRELSRLARQAQPWCADCGATAGLGVHLHPARHGEHRGATLADVQVLCRSCHGKRNGARARKGQLRICACGCGIAFVPADPRQRFYTPTHADGDRQRRHRSVTVSRPDDREIASIDGSRGDQERGAAAPRDRGAGSDS
jgi:5-methylcytosine-specific restriction enzyme A